MENEKLLKVVVSEEEYKTVMDIMRSALEQAEKKYKRGFIYYDELKNVISATNAIMMCVEPLEV